MTNPFAPIGERQQAHREKAADAAEQRRAPIRAAFSGAPHAVAWLRQALDLANGQPSFRPGMTALDAAYNEGRRAAVRELLAAIDDALHPPVGGIEHHPG